jgi:type IV secretory pathway protease TraF
MAVALVINCVTMRMIRVMTKTDTSNSARVKAWRVRRVAMSADDFVIID